MYQLNYHSKSVSELELNQLEHILETANVVNANKDVSGCLVYYNSSFVQILEGNKKDVLDVFEKIKTDNRHHSITLLWENYVDKRYFNKWSMAFHSPEDQFSTQFVNNLLMLSSFSEKNSGSLRSFWGHVRRILESDSNQNIEA
ncbi:BLUF domain-containing protein [Formosa algae]|uniref:BLUF domain-containing protein n=1 Tax=Formosa algae TaxID=225843 RepID=UPI000CCECEE0|nr:BLUF domain-containing protein [Formosa algae]PNW29124.1 hypothetical protein BKP44_05940 [Formosa algae]